jgi:hypothetical protein
MKEYLHAKMMQGLDIGEQYHILLQRLIDFRYGCILSLLRNAMKQISSHNHYINFKG